MKETEFYDFFFFYIQSRCGGVPESSMCGFCHKICRSENAKHHLKNKEPAFMMPSLPHSPTSVEKSQSLDISRSFTLLVFLYMRFLCSSCICIWVFYLIRDCASRDPIGPFF